jgi:hypothetical protein
MSSTNWPIDLRHRPEWTFMPVGVALSFLLSVASVCQANDEAPAKDPADQKASADSPSPELSPEDVIRFQVGALSGKGDRSQRIKRCYRFASPANRQNTGPIEKFERMIRSPEYAALLDARRFLVGRAHVESPELVHLLVTLVDGDGNLTCYRCFLTKQSEPPYRNCWMTDAVVRVGRFEHEKIVPPKPNDDAETI